MFFKENILLLQGKQVRLEKSPFKLSLYLQELISRIK